MEIAHVSDLHFAWARRDMGVSPRRLLNKRVLGWVNMTFHRKHPLRIAHALRDDLNHNPPDHLVVSGDLTNLALPGELRQARAWLEHLHLPPERITLIPGNHDAYVKDGLSHFEEALSPWLPGEAWPRVQENGPVAFFGTSSSLPVPWFRAWGALGTEQLVALELQIRASQAPLKAVVVHHPPVLGDGRPDAHRRNNRDWERLVELCLGRVDWILCGHTHKAFSYTFPGERPLHVFCAGSTTALPKTFGAGATYNRYQVAQGALQGVEVRGYDPEAAHFAPLPTPRRPLALTLDA